MPRVGFSALDEDVLIHTHTRFLYVHITLFGSCWRSVPPDGACAPLEKSPVCSFSKRRTGVATGTLRVMFERYYYYYVEASVTARRCC